MNKLTSELVTAPTTEFMGICGISTNATPSQGNYFMASMLAVYP